MTDEKKEYLYGMVRGSLYFFPQEIALRHARIRFALEKGRTWEELLALLKPEDIKSLFDMSGLECEEGDYDEDDDWGHDRENYSYDDYLELQTEMENWLPPDIVSRFGRSLPSQSDKTIVEFRPGDANAIVALLGERGFVCKKNDGMLAYVMGDFTSVKPYRKNLIKTHSP